MTGRLESFWTEAREALATARSAGDWQAACERVGFAAEQRLGEGEQLLLVIGLAKSLSPEGKRALAEAAAGDAVIEEAWQGVAA